MAHLTRGKPYVALTTISSGWKFGDVPMKVAA
jgi:hypothetical protein